MDIDQLLQSGIAQALKEIFFYDIPLAEVKLTPTRKEFNGSHTFTTFPLTKYIQKTPEEIGSALGEFLLEKVDAIKSYNVVKGFLNIELTDQYLLTQLKYVLNEDFFTPLPNHEKVMVEFSSPNTNKPLHLGHLRNNFLGDSVSAILKAYGYHVIKANLINDRGIHICKSMLAYQKFGRGETPESEGIKGDKLVGKYYVEFDKQLKALAEKLNVEGWTKEDIEKKNPLTLEVQEMLLKWEEGDEDTINLWKTMNGWVYKGFEETYQSIGIDFDKYYFESDTYILGKKVVEEGLSKGIFYKKSDGSVWINLTEEGLDEKLLLRADGTSVYITQDIGTADLKYHDFNIQKSIYVVGNEQDYHFVVLKHILNKLGRPYALGLYHLSYGMVDLPSGKMKSREGTVVDADDLVTEMISTAKSMTEELGKIDGFSEDQATTLYKTLGLGALKYYLLKVDPQKRMLFDPQESIDFHGHTGPFIQYTYARISAILRKADEMVVNYRQFPEHVAESLDKTEKAVIIHLMDYKKKLKQAAEEYAPSVISLYVYELAKLYNSFYAEISIFQNIDKSKIYFHSAFSFAVARTIKTCMMLLGILVPEKM